MPDSEMGSRKQKWYIDHVNRLGPSDPDVLRKEVHDWELAYLKALRERRPQDVSGFKRMIAAAIIGVLVQMPRRHPAPEFASGWPEMPGGGWEPASSGNGHAVVEWP